MLFMCVCKCVCVCLRLCVCRSQAMDKSRGAVALQMPYLRVVDLQEESEAHANDTFSNAGGGAARAATSGAAQCLLTCRPAYGFCRRFVQLR